MLNDAIKDNIRLPIIQRNILKNIFYELLLTGFILFKAVSIEIVLLF
jgi:hypothetical protein